MARARKQTPSKVAGARVVEGTSQGGRSVCYFPVCSCLSFCLIFFHLQVRQSARLQQAKGCNPIAGRPKGAGLSAEKTITNRHKLAEGCNRKGYSSKKLKRKASDGHSSNDSAKKKKASNCKYKITL